MPTTALFNESHHINVILLQLVIVNSDDAYDKFPVFR